MTISIIVAVAENGVIGKDNQLIWRLSEDLKQFRKITSGHSIIMGRKTFDSIGKALPNRTNIVVSRNKDLKIEGCHVVSSIEDAIELSKHYEGAEEVFIIGGDNIYKQSIKLANKIYLTKVKAQVEGDSYFDLNQILSWKIDKTTAYSKNEKNDYDFELQELTRR